MKPKPFRIIRIVQGVVVLLFILGLYSVLPYILQLAGVESYVILTNSMEHKNVDEDLFESYWDNVGVEPSELPHRKGLNIGDLVIIDTTVKDYSIGDVVLIKTPKDPNVRIHRVFAYNQTHFRDIADAALTNERNRSTWIVVRGSSITTTNDSESVVNADQVYWGYEYERYTNYWRATSYLKGTVSFVFPKAGLIHLLIHPFQLKRIQGAKEDDILI